MNPSESQFTRIKVMPSAANETNNFDLYSGKKRRGVKLDSEGHTDRERTESGKADDRETTEKNTDDSATPHHYKINTAKPSEFTPSSNPQVLAGDTDATWYPKGFKG